jgi:hypothetical protein
MTIPFRVKKLSAAFLTAMLTVTALTAVPAQAHESGKSYYVDSVAGNDAGPGTKAQPWKSLDKVNGAAFQPGDKVLFKAGSSWTGTLKPPSSGAAGAPIVFDKYDHGPDPVINGGGADEAVFLYNVQYVTVQNLEITNTAATVKQRDGILVAGQGSGTLHGIYLRNLNIHDIKGISDRDHGMYLNAAIYVTAWDGAEGAPVASFDDLRVENNNIHDISTIGFYSNGTGYHWNDTSTFGSWYTHMVIRGNTIARTGADGIVIGYGNAPLIEYNSSYDNGVNGTNHRWIAGVWSWATKDATFQYNEVARVHYQQGVDNDSMAFDTDIHTYGTHTYQYNYSHDNSGGFFMSTGDLAGNSGKNTVRYNISQNDRHQHWTDATISVGDSGATVFYNNTFYAASNIGFKIQGPPANAWEPNSHDVVFENNIFDIQGGPTDFPSSQIYKNNLYYGFAPPAGDTAAIFGDPQLAAPGTGGDGRNTAEGYKLTAKSPAIGSGMIIAGNGGQDFFGHPLPKGAPDIGASQSKGKGQEH